MSPASAWAQIRPAPAGTHVVQAPRVVEGPRVVEIIAIPDADAIAMLRQVLGPHPFPAASIRWSATDHFDKRDVLRSDPRQADVTVRAWVDLSDPRATSLYFANGSAERFLVRELKLSPAAVVLDREALGQVLQLSVNALLENDQEGLDRSEAESLLDPRAPVPHDAPPPPAPRPKGATPSTAPVRPAVEVTAFYAAQAFAREVPVVHGPGIAALASVRRAAVTLSVWASAQYQLPVDLERGGIGVGLWSAALRAGVEGAVRVSGRGERRAFSNVFVALALGGGGDVVRVTPLPGSADATAALSAAYWSLEPVVTATMRVQAALVAHVDLCVAPLVDVYLNPAHYDFRSGGVVSTVLAPFSVRPGVLVGLSVH